MKLAAKPDDQEEAKKTFTDGTKVSGLTITGGEYIVMETTGGKIAVVQVKSMSGTDNKGAGDFVFSLLTLLPYP